MNNTKKLDYIDYYRGIAILLILAGHTLIWGRNTMFQINGMLFAGATYFFVFIAGFLFWHLSYKFDTKTYYKKKLLNVICPYFLTTLPVAYLYAFCNPNPHVLASSSEGIRFLAVLFNGAFVNHPTWFIGMIAVVFLFSPLILKLKQGNKKVYITFFLCSFVYTIISVRCGLKPNIYPLSQFVLFNFSCYLKNALHFLFFYMLGIEMCDFIKKYPNLVKQNLKSAFYISLAVYVFHFIVHLFFMKHTHNLQVISKLIETFVLLFGIMLIEPKIKSNTCCDKFLKFMAQYSFGIFFIHGLFVNLFFFHTIYNQPGVKSFLFIGANTFKCFITSCGFFLCVFMGSILVLFLIKTILKKLGIKNTRMFIGV